MANPSIRFTPTANATDVSEHSKTTLKKILQESGCDSCIVTSTTRTPGRQALAMFNNIQRFGADGQLKLYGPYGDLVIQEYDKQLKNGASRQAILIAMEAKINSIGPEKVSLHCANPEKLNVFDIAPSSIEKKAAFLSVLKNAEDEKLISRFFSPGNHDPAFHIEIRQPGTGK